MEGDPQAVHFCLHKYLSRRHVDHILESFGDTLPRYTAERGAKQDKPKQARACKGPGGNLHTLQGDPHWELRWLWHAWNVHASRHYTPSWLLVVDESMLQWMGKYMPSRMFLCKKRGPLGRELKTVCDGLTSVCFSLKLITSVANLKGKVFYT